MKAMIRVACGQDLGFLREVDHHMSHETLTSVVAAGRVLVAEVEGSCIGCLRWGLFWDEIPFMNHLFVVPNWRGQKVGTSLISTWEESRSTAGYAFVLTSTRADETAQHLYRRLGYLDAGALLLPDEPTELILRKSLAAARVARDPSR